MSEPNQPQQNPKNDPPKKQDETHKHSPNQGPDVGAPGHSDRTGERRPENQNIQTPQK